MNELELGGVIRDVTIERDRLKKELAAANLQYEGARDHWDRLVGEKAALLVQNGDL
jgi:hypothetical protein